MVSNPVCPSVSTRNPPRFVDINTFALYMLLSPSIISVSE